MMKFELLPNEILLVCFQYFEGNELFDSFDGLNQRLNQLIRQVRLHLNFVYSCYQMITHQSLGNCYGVQLITNIFRYLSLLKYIRVKILLLDDDKIKTIDRVKAIYLKQIISKTYNRFFPVH